MLGGPIRESPIPTPTPSAAGLRALSVVAAALIAVVGDARAQDYGVVPIASASQPVFATAPPGDTERLFLLELLTGRIRILRLADLQILDPPFLTVSVVTGSERGLLGLAFHPDYASNGTFFVFYSDPASRLVRYQVSPGDPNVADPQSATDVLSIAQPQANHNGGWIGFGPDGYLYVASGDGGGSYDDGIGHTPGTGNAQDTTDNWLGKILRIDVDADDFPGDATRNYGIPPDNPFVGSEGDDEIWAYGLRNPWRASFDRLTGDLYIGDVGQGHCEEIDVQPADAVGGTNYGWRLREGTIETPLAGIGGPKPPGAVDPIFDYPHPERTCSDPGSPAAFVGRAVTGGVVYRGPIEALQGRYFFGDYITAGLWSLVWDGSDPALHDGTNYLDLVDHSGDPRFTPPGGAFGSIVSFGEDAAGHLYILDLGGPIYRLPEPAGGWGAAAGAALVQALGWARQRRRASRDGADPHPVARTSRDARQS